MSFGGHRGFWARNAPIREKHRTEVAEVTEGDWVRAVNEFWWTPELLGEKCPNREKHRTEVTEVTEAY